MIKTEILGGGSFKNKAWVEDVQRQLGQEFGTGVIYWNTWDKELDFGIDIAAEVEKVVATLAPEEKFNMIIKSIGSLIGLAALAKLGPEKLNKLIICGVPLADFSQEELVERYQILAKIPAEKVVVLQNENDNHGKFEDAKAFVSGINPKIPVVKMTGPESTTHNYPYYQEFKEFLRRI